MRGGKFQRESLGIESKIVQCLSCSLLYPNPFPIPESLESIYGDPDEYFSGKEEWYERSKSYEKLVHHTRETARETPRPRVHHTPFASALTRLRRDTHTQLTMTLLGRRSGTACWLTGAPPAPPPGAAVRSMPG